MFEQAFRNIDDVLRKEAGCTTELDGSRTNIHCCDSPKASFAR